METFPIKEKAHRDGPFSENEEEMKQRQEVCSKFEASKQKRLPRRVVKSIEKQRVGIDNFFWCFLAIIWG